MPNLEYYEPPIKHTPKWNVNRSYKLGEVTTYLGWDIVCVDEFKQFFEIVEKSPTFVPKEVDFPESFDYDSTPVLPTRMTKESDIATEVADSHKTCFLLMLGIIIGIIIGKLVL